MVVSRFAADLERELERLDLRCARREAAFERLRRVVGARERLDARERELAVEAREAGASWAEIGAALGLSRSQAHRRHAAADPRRRRSAEPWPPPVPPEVAEEIARLRQAAAAPAAPRPRRVRARRRRRR